MLYLRRFCKAVLLVVDGFTYASQKSKRGVVDNDADDGLTESQDKWKKGKKEIEERQYRSKHAHSYFYILQRLMC